MGGGRVVPGGREITVINTGESAHSYSFNSSLLGMGEGSSQSSPCLSSHQPAPDSCQHLSYLFLFIKNKPAQHLVA